MIEAIAESDSLQRAARLFFVGHAVEILRQHHVLDGGQIRHHVKLLENESHLFGAESG